MQDDAPPDVEASAEIGYRLGAPVAQFLGQQCLDVFGEDASGGQLRAIAGFREKRLATQPCGSLLDGHLERMVLKGVQRVVMDEDADRPLRRQQVRQLIDHVHQRMIGCADVVRVGGVVHLPLLSLRRIGFGP